MYKSNKSEAINRIDQAVELFLESAGQEVQKSAVEKAPVDQGALHQSIESKTQMWGQANGQAAVGTNLHYAIFQERGTGIYALDGGRSTPWVYRNLSGDFYYTRGVKPHQFMEKAVKETKAPIKQLATHIFGQLTS